MGGKHAVGLASPAMPLKRSIGLLGLTFVGIGGTIGSGWLFAPLLAAKVAGPASIVSWAIGGVAMLILALCFAEVIGVLPVAGGIVRIPHFTHGDLTSSVLGWSAWIGYNTAAPIETIAMMKYLASFFPWFFDGESSEAVLTTAGILFATGVLSVFVVINALGAAFFARTNTSLTWVKIGVPVIVSGAILAGSFNSGNFVVAGGFAPYGLEGIFAAVSSGGIIFALIGFRHAIDMAGEVKRPNVTLPAALTLSLLISIAIYALVQMAFLGALTPDELAGGWSALEFAHGLGPMAAIAAALGVGWISVTLMAGAVIAPFGGGLVSTGSMARLAYALSQNRLLPSFFGVLSRRGVPLRCLFLNFAFGILVVLFVSFEDAVALNSAAITLSFCAGPIAVYALRIQYREAPRRFKLPAVSVLAPLGFVVATLIVYWSGWTTTWRLGLVVLAGLAYYLVRKLADRSSLEDLDLAEARWLVPYGAGIGLLSYLGGFGGIGLLAFPVDVSLVVVLALLTFAYAQRCRLTPEKSAVYRKRYATELPTDLTPL